MTTPRLLLFALLAAAGRAEIIDGVAAVVGRQAITWSDVWREARLEAFFNHQPPPPRSRNGPEIRKILDRLIEQRLIRQEMDRTAFPSADEAQQRKWLEKIPGDGLGPAAYNLQEKDLLDYAGRRLDLLAFVELRFKAGVRPTAAEIGQYYKNTLLPDLKRAGVAPPPPLDEVRRQIEEILKQERANELMDEWLVEQRGGRVRIQIMDGEKQ